MELLGFSLSCTVVDINCLIQASQRMKSKTDVQQVPYLVIHATNIWVSGSHARIASHEYL